MSRLQADLFLLFAAVIWGLAFVFQKSAMSHVGPLTFLAARGVVAALALLPLAIQEARDQRKATVAASPSCRSPSGAASPSSSAAGCSRPD